LLCTSAGFKGGDKMGNVLVAFIVNGTNDPKKIELFRDTIAKRHISYIIHIYVEGSSEVTWIKTRQADNVIPPINIFSMGQLIDILTNGIDRESLG
jgi:hypothetical protein